MVTIYIDNTEYTTVSRSWVDEIITDALEEWPMLDGDMIEVYNNCVYLKTKVVQ